MASTKPKIGQGSVAAFLRQGLKELTHYLKAFFDSGPLIEEPGQIGNAPPQAVSQQTGHSQPVRVESPLKEIDMNAPDQEQQIELAQAAPEIAAPEIELSGEDSFLEQTMQELQQVPEMQEPEQEMSQ